MRLAVLALLLLAGCPPKMVYQEDQYILRTMTFGLAKGERAHAIHPAVLEYVFASPDGPLRVYYDALARSQEPVAELVAVEADARAIAGGAKLTGEHYARARARRMGDAFNRALGTTRGARGYAALTCCQRVDPHTGAFGGPQNMMWHAHRGARVLHVMGGPTDPDYTWDLQYVPNAFDPAKPLDYKTVERLAVPVHRTGEAR
jgi:hypothetical protein